MILFRRRREKGIRTSPQAGTVLIVVLLAMALLTAMIVEFAYGIYVSSSAVQNWADLKKASVLAESGVSFAVAFYRTELSRLDQFYPTDLSYPVPEPFPGEEGSLMYIVEDETGKLNVNKIVNPQNEITFAYESLQRLCKHLNVPQEVADIIRDWIDADNTQEVRGGEDGAKNSPLWSIAELYEITMLEREWIDALLPYLTIYGDKNDPNGKVNLNAASRPVLISLFQDAQAEQYAEEIISWREKYGGITDPDSTKATTNRNANANRLFARIPGHDFDRRRHLVKGTHFKLTCTGETGEIKRTIEAVINVAGGYEIEGWREY